MRQEVAKSSSARPRAMLLFIEKYLLVIMVDLWFVKINYRLKVAPICRRKVVL